MARLPFRPRVEGLENRLAPATFTVTNVNNSGAGSLRAAIAGANANPGADSIDFDINAPGIQKINLTAALPVISDTVTLDATTQSTFAGLPLVVLNGANAGGANGLVVAGANADNCVIKGLVIQKFAGNGIVLQSDGNTISNCFIGTNAAGTAAAGNGGNGIAILGGSANNSIGGSDPERNLISGNGTHGILMQGIGVTGNTILGNFIGSTLAAPFFALPNRFDGIALSQGANGNSIGAASITTFIAGNNRHGINMTGAGTNSNTVVNATIASNLGSGVQLAAGASNNTIGNEVAELGCVISDNGAHGVLITGARSTGNQVMGSFIGTNNEGTAAVANRFDGVAITAGAHNNTIGGPLLGAGNLISGNARFGVNISNSSRNVVSGNAIGQTFAGDAALANGSNGIQIAGNATANTIGGLSLNEGNVVSGNRGNGIAITGPGAAWNTVLGNNVGTDAAGTAALGNALDGILVSGGASHNEIGSNAPGGSNLISGNLRNGIRLTGAGTSGNAIRFNTIGLNFTEDGSIPNAASGVVIGAHATDNTIGGSGAGNTISANGRFGILVMANQSTIQSNSIGAAFDGSGSFGNGSHGVFVTGGASNTLIGGQDAFDGNIIANNGGAGILVGSDPSAAFNVLAGTGNAILGNSIFANARLGIDLGPRNGVTPNDGIDSDGGSNRTQNYPTITSATDLTGNLLIVTGLTSTPNSSYRIEFFASANQDSTGFGEGATFLGFIDVTTNGLGQATWTGTVPYTPDLGGKITATATNLATNDTSEFSRAVDVEV